MENFNEAVYVCFTSIGAYSQQAKTEAKAKKNKGQAKRSNNYFGGYHTTLEEDCLEGT